MALFWCRKCGHIREVGNDYAGKSVKCPKCDQTTKIYDTIEFVKALIQKYIAQNKKLQQVDAKEADQGNKSAEGDSIENIDIYNTNALSQADKYEPIVKWFEERQIAIQVNQDAIDTTGFFDEIALSIGNNFNVLGFVCDQIKYNQKKGYATAKLDLANKSSEEIEQINSFCKEMHEYSFVAKYFYQKKDKVIRLILQPAIRIKEFFNGIWMEWFTFMKLLELFRDKQIDVACMRSLRVTFQNDESNELDIFLLDKGGTPVCIECKSGEFRQDIDKYLHLRKRLNIEKSQFVICAFGLSDKQTQGMTSMYDLTFTNETNLIDHVASIIKAG